MSNTKLKAMYVRFDEMLARPKVHLSEHEKFLIDINVNSAFNTFKSLFSAELAAEGLSIEFIDYDIPTYEFMKDAKESEVAHV